MKLTKEIIKEMIEKEKQKILNEKKEKQAKEAEEKESK